MKEITLGQNGLPPKKKNYSSEEKAIIIAKAAEVGTRTVADAYDIDFDTPLRRGKSTTLNKLLLISNTNQPSSSFNLQMVGR